MRNRKTGNLKVSARIVDESIKNALGLDRDAHCLIFEGFSLYVAKDDESTRFIIVQEPYRFVRVDEQWAVKVHVLEIENRLAMYKTPEKILGILQDPSLLNQTVNAMFATVVFAAERIVGMSNRKKKPKIIFDVDNSIYREKGTYVALEKTLIQSSPLPVRVSRIGKAAGIVKMA